MSWKFTPLCFLSCIRLFTHFVQFGWIIACGISFVHSTDVCQKAFISEVFADPTDQLDEDAEFIETYLPQGSNLCQYRIQEADHILIEFQGGHKETFFAHLNLSKALIKLSPQNSSVSIWCAACSSGSLQTDTS